jgi:ATPase subunit of ABC transporter with duplicated ATPase domains
MSMPLVTVRNLSLRFRGPPLLDDVTCHVEAGQRVGLLGRNGAGKTSLLRLLAGVIDPDAGTVEFAPGARVALLQQDVPQDVASRVREVVAAGLPAATAETAWEHEQAVTQLLTRMNLDGDADFQALSAGMKRRVLLARAVVGQPDLLLLDEPTNHLDIEAVEWLEAFLGRWRGTLMFVTHDRTFLRRMADRILEIDRGRIFDWSCDYDTFLVRKEEALAAEEKANALFDTRLAQEEAWIERKEALALAQAALAKAQADLDLLEAGSWQYDRDVAQATLSRAEAEAAKIEIELDRLVVRALVDGRVLQVNVRPGEFVGTPPNQPLIVLGNTDRLHVRVDIDEYDITRFQPEARAVALPRGDLQEEYPLEFVRVEPFVVPKKSLTGDNTERVDTRVLQVIYKFDPADRPPLFVGQQVEVFIDAVQDAD